MSVKRSIILTQDAPAPIGPYSQGVEAFGAFVFVSGQVPIDPKTGLLLIGDIQAQTRRVLENLQAILAKAGASLGSVVKTTVFLKDMNDFSLMNEVYAKYFPEDPPARTTVEVSRLPKDARIEVDAVALVDNR